MTTARFVDVVNAREAIAAGWSVEQLAACGMIVKSGGIAAGARRRSQRTLNEIEVGRRVAELGGLWAMDGLRLDVIGNSVWEPITQHLDPRLILRCPRALRDAQLESWRRQGWVQRDDEAMVSTWRAEIERATPPDHAPVEYMTIDPVAKVLETYAFALDVSHPRAAEWIFRRQLEIREEVSEGGRGPDAWVVGFKSGVWDNPPSVWMRPRGRLILRAAGGSYELEPHPWPASGTVIVPGVYGPGVFEVHSMAYLRRLVAAGFRIVLNEAYAHRGTRWLWADAYPDVAAELVGELVRREPWRTAA